jgi:hypothetical protein
MRRNPVARKTARFLVRGAKKTAFNLLLTQLANFAKLFA